MSDTRPPMRIRWTIELLPETNTVRALCIDSGTDKRLDFYFPAESLPALHRGLQELLNAHADRFPTVLKEIVTGHSLGQN